MFLLVMEYGTNHAIVERFGQREEAEARLASTRMSHKVTRAYVTEVDELPNWTYADPEHTPCYLPMRKDGLPSKRVAHETCFWCGEKTVPYRMGQHYPEDVRCKRQQGMSERQVVEMLVKELCDV